MIQLVVHNTVTNYHQQRDLQSGMKPSSGDTNAFPPTMIILLRTFVAHAITRHWDHHPRQIHPPKRQLFGEFGFFMAYALLFFSELKKRAATEIKIVKKHFEDSFCVLCLL